MDSGIYQIKNILSNKIYVGSAKNFKHRWSRHISKLKLNKHENVYLQNAWNKYGEENFSFEILEEIPNLENLLHRENYWIKELNATDRNYGYNICLTAGSRLGVKVSEEVRLKLSLAGKGRVSPMKGKITSLEVREKQRKAKLGKKLSAEHRAKIVLKLKGRPVSLETRLKISQSNKETKGKNKNGN